MHNNSVEKQFTSEGHKIQGWYFDNSNGKQYVLIEKFGRCEYDRELDAFLTYNDKGEDVAHVL